ncbi:hypothetical protein [Agilicoccus flavus]|uniref:hypothetical protein n=1 Tax=Agilicoccus flavus TaxID=2775968 RepID=UPI001CF6380C|nr:hypothetical protein [Agilicoccus flavus]
MAALAAVALALSTAWTPALFVVAGAGMLGLAAGWVLLLGLPSPRGTTATLVGASVILLASGLLSRELRESVLPGALALAMIVEFVHQLARRDGRPRLVESVSGSITGISVLTSIACLLLIPDDPDGVAATATVMAAVVAGCLGDVARVVGFADRTSAFIALAAGGVAALGAGLALSLDLGWWVLLFAGVLTGGASHGVRQAQSILPTLARRRARIASGLASVLSVGVVAYALAWLSLGPEMMAAITR